MDRKINAKIYIENVENAHFAAQTPLPNTIPLIADFFVGRKESRKSLRESYQKGLRRFVLHGIGGVGKTALALQFADEISSNFEAKVFVGMQGMSRTPYSARDAMLEIVRQFDPQIRADISPIQLKSVFIQFLQNQKTLVVLDNAENRQSVEALTAANACFIVTSRKVFALTGGKRIKVQKMSPGDAAKLLVGIAGKKRLNGQTTKLTKLAGYLPMALKPLASILAEDDLEKAANLVDKYSRKIGELLSERVPDYDDLTIRASFELSYEKLSVEMAKNWRRLSVFPSDFDEAAITTVLNISEEAANETQKQLRQYSLLEVALETRRFHLHDLARVFTSEKLSDEERFETYILFAKYYASLLIRAKDMQTGKEENYYRNVLKLVDTEWDNIAAGQKWTSELIGKDNEVAELCTVYSDYVHEFLSLRIHPHQDIEWLNSGLRAARKLNLRQSESNTLNNIGLAHKNLGDNRRAAEFYEEALKISREIGYPLGVGNTLNNLGTAYNSLGEHQKAIEYYLQSLEVSRELENKLGESNTLNNLGLVHANLGKYHKAIEYYEQTLEIKYKIGNTRGIGNTLSALGTAYKQIGENQKAIERYEQSLEISRELGNKLGEAAALNGLGLVNTIQGKYRKAIENHGQALEIARKASNSLLESNTLNNLGLAYKDLGEYEKALDCHEKALIIKSALGAKLGECNTLNNIGSVLKRLGENREAIQYHQKALKISRRIKYKLGEANSLDNIGTAYTNLGEYEKAIQYQLEGLDISREINNRLVESYCLCNLGKAYANLGKYKEAIEYETKALELSRQLGEQLVEANSLGYLGVSYCGLDEKEKGCDLLKKAVSILKEIESPEASNFRQLIEKNC